VRCRVGFCNVGENLVAALEEELDIRLLAICQERSEKKHDSNSNNVNSFGMSGSTTT
jgi:hypothetical protein